MENGHAHGTSNEFGGIESYADILNRRQKNRERQRRYRAKKRLLADLKAVRDRKPLDQARLEGKMNKISTNGLTGGHRKRNWKRDARMAHLSQQPVAGTNCASTSSAALMNESEAPNLLLQMRTELSVHPSSSNNIQTKATTQTKRDWKADARKRN